jgi:hypothetical protein
LEWFLSMETHKILRKTLSMRSTLVCQRRQAEIQPFSFLAMIVVPIICVVHGNIFILYEFLQRIFPIQFNTSFGFLRFMET